MSSYREHFETERAATDYERVEYGPTSYSQLLWNLEQPILLREAEEIRRRKLGFELLDFASGTGRIAAFLEAMAGRSVAIEISASMAAIARQRVTRTAVLCRDITQPDAEREGGYDLITAFRFVLNAEPTLRLAAFRALAARLRDADSRLVFNNHGNLWSAKIIGWPYHRLRRRGWQPAGNYLRHSEVMQLCRQAGLRILRREGVGLLGGKFCRLLPLSAASGLEGWLSRTTLARYVAQDIVYVAALDHGT